MSANFKRQMAAAGLTYVIGAAIMLLPVWENAVAQSAAVGPGSTSDEYRQHDPVSPVGIGGQVGDPSGISLKIYRKSDGQGLFKSAKAFSFLAAWDLEDFFFLNAHALYEKPIPDSPLNYYLGPGAIVGVDDRPASDVELVLGISGNFGLNFFTEHFEVYLELTPWIKIVPETEGELGGGIGLRYYF